MSKTKYTKGNWKQIKHKLDASLFGQGIQQRIGSIETDDGLKIADVFDTAFPDMNKANLALLAAAPEMLKALELCLDHGALGTFGKDAESLVELVELTIALAKGE